MRTRLLTPLALLLLSTATARGAVVVIANYTTEAVTFTVAEPKEKARKHTISANHVVPVYVTGPADLTVRTNGRDTPHRVEAYNAYAFVPDRVAGVRLEGIELSGNQLERDARPELNPTPREPVKIPVTLFVDDVEPRAEKLWQKELRARFDEVADVIEKASSIRLEFAGFSTWQSDPEAKNMTELLTHFENAVKVKPGTLALGYTSRKIDEKVDPSFGVNRGLGGRHVLLREWRPKSEPERVEVLLHFVAKALGAVGSPDPGSAMRAKLADSYILRAGAVLRLDPLNVLALNLWADERRRDPAVELATLAPVYRHRLARVYKALRHAIDGDLLVVEYLGSLDGELAKQPDPKVMPPDRPMPMPATKRDELVRKIVTGISEFAKKNSGQGASALTGDDLTAAYVRTAAAIATSDPSPEMVPAFLIALGIAFDDTDALLNDPTTASVAKDVETPEERKARLAVLGNPTLAGRRDLCRRFFIGCATGELLPQHGAEFVAVGRAMADLNTPSGLSFSALAAEFAGISFARATSNDAEVLRAVMMQFKAADYVPPVTGLRNGFSVERFAELYGGDSDDRFLAVLANIRKRLKAMPVYK